MQARETPAAVPDLKQVVAQPAPGNEIVEGEEGGVTGDAEPHAAAVGEWVVDALGDGEAVCLRVEVMVVDSDGLWFPSGPGIAEAAAQLILLRINADGGGVVPGAVRAQAGDNLELGVAFGAGGGRQALGVDPQRVAHGAQQSRDGARGDLPVRFCRQVVREVAGGATDPAQVGAGVARRFVAEQCRELGGQCGRFSSSALRPPPGSRMSWRRRLPHKLRKPT